jgi:hypothetical protein
MSEQRKNYRWPSLSLRHIRRFGRSPEGHIPDTRGNARSSLAIMLVAALVLAVFASRELRLFARDLPGNRVTDVLVAAADGWHGAMQRLGPARISPAIRRIFQRWRDASW